jgi:3'(2'), 5'-bisphosphate nucleotidase
LEVIYLKMLDFIDIDQICNVAKEAGKAILEVYNQDFEVIKKYDDTPVTQADLKANDIICTSLQKLFPNIPSMSEENALDNYEQRKAWKYYWCIDPLDGTKEFVNKNDEFTVNIALMQNNIPVLGVVYAPVFDDLFYAKAGTGAFRNGNKIPVKRDDDKLIFGVSRSHLNTATKEFIDNFQTSKTKKTIAMGSSLKLCLCSAGEIDMIPRFGPTSEWDTAASDAIARCCGKSFINPETQKPLKYNKQDIKNPDFILI